ncbi:MAG: SidE phosphodiesterase domain-containing protein, partial [Desulfovibrionales bacterium]|nr:SidE phosphodiesterase domain-containing protein [Desulfovibrionales bacterium]
MMRDCLGRVFDCFKRRSPSPQEESIDLEQTAKRIKLSSEARPISAAGSEPTVSSTSLLDSRKIEQAADISSPLDSRSRSPVFNLQFLAESQALVHRYMHRPLPGQSDWKPGMIARPVHGAIHLSRTSIWIAVLLTFRIQLGDSEAAKMTRAELAALMKAGLLHDSGREGEGTDLPEWEQASGEQCEDHLLSIGCCPRLAAACREGIINKDRADRSQKNLIEKLIHDADCLEIMRVYPHFDMAELDLFQDFKGRDNIHEQIYQLAGQIRSVIAQQEKKGFDVTISNSETHWHKQNQERTLTGYPIVSKTALEFAPNALVSQIDFLKRHAQDLYQLFRQSAGEPETLPSLLPTTWTRLTG